MVENLKALCGCLQRYLKDTSGAAAVVFAFVLPVLVGGAGLAVDVAQAYNVQTRLGNALDKAALAAANSIGTEQELQDRMEDFFFANYPDDRIGSPYDVTLLVSNDGNTIDVSASAQVDTKFMRLFGHDTMEVSVAAQVQRELAGIEVVLVLDVTGSMAGSNITALKQAATDFVNIMFDRITDTDFIKVGIVPYAQSVNVGAYGFGLDMSGNVYGNGSQFVNYPAVDDFFNPTTDIEYNPAQNLHWHGCVLAEPYPDDTRDDARDWEMYRWPRYCTDQRWWGCANWFENPNNRCPDTQNTVMPMNNDRNALLAKINGLSTGGNTYGNIGMVWGWRVISPEEPFTEGEPYEEPRWRKAILMMTDGDNTMHNTYSVYGWTPSHSISAGDLDVRLEETCNNAKAEGIQIYTVTFQSGINETTKGYYERCATQPAMYFHAPSNEELVETFQEIANQLSQLHISQ